MRRCRDSFLGECLLVTYDGTKCSICAVATDAHVIASQSADWRGNLPVQSLFLRCRSVNGTRRLPRRPDGLLAMTWWSVLSALIVTYCISISIKLVNFLQRKWINGAVIPDTKPLPNQSISPRSGSLLRFPLWKRSHLPGLPPACLHCHQPGALRR